MSSHATSVSSIIVEWPTNSYVILIEFRVLGFIWDSNRSGWGTLFWMFCCLSGGSGRWGYVSFLLRLFTPFSWNTLQLVFVGVIECCLTFLALIPFIPFFSSASLSLVKSHLKNLGKASASIGSINVVLSQNQNLCSRKQKKPELN